MVVSCRGEKRDIRTLKDLVHLLWGEKPDEDEIKGLEDNIIFQKYLDYGKSHYHSSESAFEDYFYFFDGFNEYGKKPEDYDLNGFDSEGYDIYGFDREGFDREGYDIYGFDRNRYNKSGLDCAGFNKDGLPRIEEEVIEEKDHEHKSFFSEEEENWYWFRG